ncbi:MAG: hypothetical protein M5U34_18280 [Chloroflexi bacterium]|nr:hypothetical protein [Chloroflexota bacterium]
MKYIKQIQLWQKQNYCLFIISMFLFVGCTPTTISNLANPATATWISNQSDMLTQITQESISQQSTTTNPPQFGETLTVTLLPASSIPLPTIISSTPTPPSTPTPVPTLTGEQNTEYFIRLMKRNGDCELPCW